MELERIIDLGYELGMTQERYEITEAASFLKREKINSFLEIGTDRGGTFLVWSKILEKEDGVKISIDWAHGPWGNNQYNIEERDKTLKSIGGNVKIVAKVHGISVTYPEFSTTTQVNEWLWTDRSHSLINSL